MEDFDGAFASIFRHLGLKGADLDMAMSLPVSRPLSSA